MFLESIPHSCFHCWLKISFKITQVKKDEKKDKEKEKPQESSAQKPPMFIAKQLSLDPSPSVSARCVITDWIDGLIGMITTSRNNVMK